MRSQSTSGQRNTRVEFQKNTPTTNDDGQTVPSWTTRFSRWVNIVPRGGGERWLFQQVRAEIDNAMHVEYDADIAAITPAIWRVKIGSRIMNLESIFDPDGKSKRLRLMLTEVLS
jgi:SPP1 family predicted phage head-tail adaptor